MCSQGLLSDVDKVIEFDSVPIVTPAGEVLLPSLSFRVEAGNNVLVAGPNGCGKSSIFRYVARQTRAQSSSPAFTRKPTQEMDLCPRITHSLTPCPPPPPASVCVMMVLANIRILCGLWPLRGGRVIKPSRGQLFYIPQKPYLTLGSLRDQVIYPHSPEDMMMMMAKTPRATDDDILKLLTQVVRWSRRKTKKGGEREGGRVSSWQAGRHVCV